MSQLKTNRIAPLHRMNVSVEAIMDANASPLLEKLDVPNGALASVVSSLPRKLDK